MYVQHFSAHFFSRSQHNLSQVLSNATVLASAYSADSIHVSPGHGELDTHLHLTTSDVSIITFNMAGV